MKLGMVFEGGANRTVFSCGVMDKFLEENIMPDYYIGVSAGMAYGLSYLSGQKGRNLELMEKYMADKRYMGMRHLLNRKEHAYYNTKFVFEEVPNEILPLDYDALARFPGEIEAAVTNIHTGKAEYMMEDHDFDRLMKICRASSSMPLVSPIVNIDEVPYLDGGIADSIPLRRAMELGNKKIVLILTRNPGYRKKPISKGMAGIYRKAYKKYPNLVRAAIRRNHVYNQTMEHVEKLEEEGKIFVLRPLIPTVSRLEKDYDTLMNFYNHGYKLMEKQYDAMMKYLEE